MATFTFTQVAPQFPVGTTVGCYLARQKVAGSVPSGSTVTTAVVASDASLAFTGLANDIAYVAYALVDGAYHYIGFHTDPSATGTGFDASIVDAKGDLIVGLADDTASNLAVGSDGQILTAASGQTAGVQWAAAPASGIQATLVDAKGDLIVATADNTVARKAVGTNGTVLTADSSAAGGVAWASGVPQGLQVITAGNLGASYTPALASQKDTLLTGTLNANCTLGSPTGGVAGATLTMEITQGAAYSLTLFSSLKPGGNIALSGAAGAVDVMTAYTPDGTNWRVFLAGAGMT